MAIERSHRPLAAARLATIARQPLDASTLCAIATVTPNSSAHINSAYFAWSRELEIVWLSEPRARQSRNLASNESVVIAVYDSNQTWGTPDSGIQLFGSASEARGGNAKKAESLYGFPDFTAEADLGAYRLYVFRPRRIKRASARCRHVRDCPHRSRREAGVGTGGYLPLRRVKANARFCGWPLSAHARRHDYPRRSNRRLRDPATSRKQNPEADE
jgi:hypothetical protein